MNAVRAREASGRERLAVMEDQVGVTAGTRSNTAKVVVVALIAVPFLGAVFLTAARVGDTARFVTWAVAAFTALASAVALLGLWIGLDRPWLLLSGIPPALVVAYVLPIAPIPVITAVLLALAALAAGVRGIAAGIAMTVGAAMTLFVVLQGPAVECQVNGVSSNSGPWWVGAPPSSSSSGSGRGVAGRFSGTTQVGSRHYAFECDGTRLVRFDRTE